MSGSSDEVIVLVASWVLTTTMMFAIVMGDERDLSEQQAERAWPPASRAAAIVAFGPLALPFHFAKTRGDFASARGVLRGLFGFALGIGCSAGMMVVASFVLSFLLSLVGVAVE